MSNYNVFLNNLKSEKQKNKLKEIFELLQIEKEEIIKKEIEIDHKHLEIVNFCANLFKPFTMLYRETEYKLLLYEPLSELDIRNFDIAIYNTNSNVLILVECKSSYSDHKDKVDDIREEIKIMNENLAKLEDAIGDDIKKN